MSGLTTDLIPDDADSASNGPDSTDALDVITKIIPIAPGSKYVILIPDDTETELIFKLQDLLRDWWADDDEPFMIISDKFEFVKVDGDTQVPALASCGAEKCPGHVPGAGEEPCPGQTNPT